MKARNLNWFDNTRRASSRPVNMGILQPEALWKHECAQMHRVAQCSEHKAAWCKSSAVSSLLQMAMCFHNRQFHFHYKLAQGIVLVSMQIIFTICKKRKMLGGTGVPREKEGVNRERMKERKKIQLRDGELEKWRRKSEGQNRKKWLGRFALVLWGSVIQRWSLCVIGCEYTE